MRLVIAHDELYATYIVKLKEVISMLVVYRTGSLAFLVTFAVLILSGCMNYKINIPPIYVDEAAFAQNMDAIYVPPVIDARTDKSADFKDSDIKNLRELVVNNLERLGYHAQLLDAWSTDKQPSDKDLFDLDAADLCMITPPDAKIFLVITINDISDILKVNTFPSPKVCYSITGMLMVVDRGKKEEIWKEVASGTDGGSGLIGGSMSAITMKGFAQEKMMKQAFSSFPDRVKK